MSDPLTITLKQAMEFAMTGVAGIGSGYVEGSRVTLSRVGAGTLRLPTGRICVTDAYSADVYTPLNRIAPSGDYPVTCVLAEIGQQGYSGGRIAFVVVTFVDAPVAHWTDITSVEPAPPCFVDADPNVVVQEGGLGLFSMESAEEHFALLRRDYEGHVNHLKELRKSHRKRGWFEYAPGTQGAHAFIIDGGLGDGKARCWCGLTQVGRLARLVIDYNIALPSLA